MTDTAPRRARRPAFDPVDRIGTAKFLEITRLGRTTFFARYRSDPYWETRFDIRVDPLTGNLHMSRAAAEKFALERRGEPGRSPRASRLGHHANIHNTTQSKTQENPPDEIYGVQLAALSQAFSGGLITRAQFNRAVADLEHQQ